MKTLLEQLRTELPVLISRREAAELGRWAPGTLANKDSRGEGPERVFVGGRTMYPRDAFLEWFAGQISPRPAGPRPGGEK
jgi:hypothetical protein